MYWILIFFLFVIVLMVIYTHKAKAEKESHNWHTDEKHIHEKPKIKMQELACCHTTFYDSTDPARIEKAYKEACERGGREGFFPVLLVLEDNLIINILDQLGIKDDKKRIDMARVQARRQELMHSTENAKDWLDLRLRELQNGFETEYPDFYRTDVLGEYVENGIGNTSFNGIINDETVRTLPLLLAEVPVNQPWQILAWFPIGGWDNCPKAEHLVSVAKHWYEGFGAVPAVISEGIIEFAFPNLSVKRKVFHWPKSTMPSAPISSTKVSGRSMHWPTFCENPRFGFFGGSEHGATKKEALPDIKS